MNFNEFVLFLIKPLRVFAYVEQHCNHMQDFGRHLLFDKLSSSNPESKPSTLPTAVLSVLEDFSGMSSSSLLLSYFELLNLGQIFIHFSLALVVDCMLGNYGKANHLCQEIFLERKDPLCSQEITFLNGLK